MMWVRLQPGKDRIPHTAFHIGMEGKPLLLHPLHPKAVKEARSEMVQTWDLNNCWSFMSASTAISGHSANPCLSETALERSFSEFFVGLALQQES